MNLGREGATKDVSHGTAIQCPHMYRKELHVVLTLHMGNPRALGSVVVPMSTHEEQRDRKSL